MLFRSFGVDEAGIRIPPASSTSVVAGGGRHKNCALYPRPARQPMTATQADPSLQALMLPFADGTLAWPRDGALFLRARDGWPLHERPLPGLVCEQGFQPDAQALERSGLDRKSTRLNSSH